MLREMMYLDTWDTLEAEARIDEENGNSKYAGHND